MPISYSNRARSCICNQDTMLSGVDHAAKIPGAFYTIFNAATVAKLNGSISNGFRNFNVQSLKIRPNQSNQLGKDVTRVRGSSVFHQVITGPTHESPVHQVCTYLDRYVYIIIYNIAQKAFTYSFPRLYQYITKYLHYIPISKLVHPRDYFSSQYSYLFIY